MLVDRVLIVWASCDSSCLQNEVPTTARLRCWCHRGGKTLCRSRSRTECLEGSARRLLPPSSVKRPLWSSYPCPSANCTRVDLCLLPLLLNTFLAEMPPSMLSFKLLQFVITLIGKCSSVLSSGKTLAPFSTSHNIARVYSAGSRASRHTLASAWFVSTPCPGHERYWNGFGFLKIVLNHQTDQGTMLRTNTDTLLFCPCQPLIV